MSDVCYLFLTCGNWDLHLQHCGISKYMVWAKIFDYNSIALGEPEISGNVTNRIQTINRIHNTINDSDISLDISPSKPVLFKIILQCGLKQTQWWSMQFVRCRARTQCILSFRAYRATRQGHQPIPTIIKLQIGIIIQNTDSCQFWW